MPQASLKLLGIHIDHAFTLKKKHLSTTWKKARRQLNALGRLSNILNEREKCVLFECFGMSRFNNCPAIWDFGKISDFKKIEKYPEADLKDYSSTYTELRNMACKPLLCVHRIKLIMMEIFQLIHETGPCYLRDVFVRKVDIHNHNVGCSFTVWCLNLELYSMVSTRCVFFCVCVVALGCSLASLKLCVICTSLSF